MKPDWLRGFITGSLLTRSCGDASHLRWTCDFLDERRLSTWQIAKKAMWDRVREARIVSMHPNMLLQTAMTLESPRLADQCPLGLLACRLFLVDIIPTLSSRHDDEDTVASWMEELLREVLDTPWERIVNSGWPIFGLLARLARHPFIVMKPVESLSPWHDMSAALAPLLDDAVLAKTQQTIVDSLLANSAGNLLGSFVQSGSAAVWSALSSYTEESVFQKALQLGPNPQARNMALHFLRHLQHEFAGSSGSVDVFLQKLLSGLSVQALSDMKCWDVGAAPWPDESNRRDRDVWQICSSMGVATQAFEPSQAP